jgi:hypothetical protein
MAADGELLAVEPDRVYLARGDQVTVVPLICIEKLKVGAFETTAEPLAWGTVGALTTLSHGYFLVFSLPTWLLSTAPASRVHSSAGHIEEPRPGEAAPKLENLRKWARFPQGMPAGYLEQAREIRERRGSCEIFGPRPKPAAPTPEASRPAPAAPGLAPWQPEAPSGGAR